MNRRAAVAVAAIASLFSVVALAQKQKPGGLLRPTSDVLLLRDGETIKGTLPVCEPDECRMGNKTYRRELIAWIGFGTGSDTPPLVKDNSEDEIHLRDGSIAHAHLVGVSLGEVDVQGASYDRSDVAWIHIANAPPLPPPKGKIPAVEEPPKKDDTVEPPPPPPPLPRPSKKFERGHLWSGQIHIHLHVTYHDSTSDLRTDVSAHLREFVYPLLRSGGRYGTLIHLEPEGTEVRSRYTDSSGNAENGSSCDGHGALSLTLQPDTPGYGHGSVVWSVRTDVDTTPLVGFPLVRGTPRYVLSLSTRNSDKFSIDCKSWTTDARGRHEYDHTREQHHWLVVIGRIPMTQCPPQDHLCDPQVRTISGEGGPMHGSFHNAWTEDEFHKELQVRWSLCRDDAPCNEEPPEAENNPCQGTGIQDGLLQVCRDEERAIFKKMMEKWRDYQSARNKALPHQDDFSRAIRSCQAWEVLELALEALVVLDIPSIGLSEHDAEIVKAFKEQLEAGIQIYKAASEGNPIEAFKVSEIKKLELVANSIRLMVESFDLLSHNAPEQFLAHLDECNAPISQETRSSAEDYLLNMQRAFEALDQYAKLENDLRSKDDECQKKQLDAYNACVEDARCNGTPESACQSKRPEGN